MSSSTNENTLPIHSTTTPQPSSSNYTTAAAAKAAQDKLDQATVKVRDGRRNSVGEELPSPVDTWRPNLDRKQSWNHQDLKRQFVMTELEKGEQGVKGGFSEAGK